MDTHDVILIQEHWLFPDDLNELSRLKNNFLYFASSAMDNKISQNSLVGRPFGGVAILYNQVKITNIKCIFKSSRIIACVIGKTVIVNIYLPNCIIKTDYLLELHDLFSMIGNIIDDHQGYEIIVAGDFNFEFSTASCGFQFLERFMNDFKLRACDVFLSSDIKYTFHIEKNLGIDLALITLYALMEYTIASMNYESQTVAEIYRTILL